MPRFRIAAPLIRFALRLSVIVTLALSSALQQAQTVTHAATLRTVALSGVTPGVGFGYEPPVLNDAGQVAFTNSFEIWSEGSGSLTRVARVGDHAPGTPDGVRFGALGNGFVPVVLNDATQTAFLADVPFGARSILSDRSGSLALVMRAGSQALGLPSGVNFTGVLTSYPVLNNAGQVAFGGSLVGSGVDSTNSRGIWSEGSGTLAMVARAGDHAPGAPDGVNFRSFYTFVLNDAGQTAFGAFLTDGRFRLLGH